MTPPAASTAAARSGARIARPARAPIAPRRVSGPARHPRARTPEPSLVMGIGWLVDHHLLERTLRGRLWILIITAALVGLVTINVFSVGLEARIGRSLNQVTVLQRDNAQLSDQVAQLAGEARVAEQAAALGMVYAPAGAFRYLHVRPGDAARAAARLASSSSTTTPLGAQAGG